MKEARNFKGVWIPAEIWLSTELEIIDKVLLIEIDSLDNEFGCIATNQYFATFFQRSTTRISQVISKLFDMGFINLSYTNDSKRTITTTDKYKSLKGGFNILKGGLENCKGGLENCKGGLENCKGGLENCKGGLENCKPNSNPFSNSFNNKFSVCVENTPTQKISNENLNSQKDTLQKVAPKSFPSELSFEKSIYNSFENFCLLLNELNVRTSDHEAIFKKISLNAKSKNLLKSDWKAYIELWINNDIDKGTVQLKKATNQENAKNDTSMLDDKQSEVLRKVRIIYKDFSEGLFNTEKLRMSVVDGLRLLWKDANDFNKELITDVVSKINDSKPELEVEIISKKDQDKPKRKANGLGSRMRDKFNKQI